ncbi:hypothetical protein, partial [Pseudoxanthomonas suwonensis]|uniref:hypothetical protein n=1 Tax=Pseudoxanthomonas suwonensis TaxID=314722 RepID=UPI00138F4186
MKTKLSALAVAIGLVIHPYAFAQEQQEQTGQPGGTEVAAEEGAVSTTAIVAGTALAAAGILAAAARAVPATIAVVLT